MRNLLLQPLKRVKAKNIVTLVSCQEVIGKFKDWYPIARINKCFKTKGP